MSEIYHTYLIFQMESGKQSSDAPLHLREGVLMLTGLSFGGLWILVWRFIGRKKERGYRVLWSRPAYSKIALVAGEFPAKDDEDAQIIFERDYKNGQRFGGDELVLVCIVQPERTREVGRRKACSAGDDY